MECHAKLWIGAGWKMQGKSLRENTMMGIENRHPFGAVASMNSLTPLGLPFS